MKATALLLLLFFFTTPPDSGAQTSPAVSNFSIEQEGAHVLVSWRIKESFTCEDVQVERSLDGEIFQKVYVYPGICGGTPQEIRYTYEDAGLPVAPVIYYRLNLGGYGYSEILSLEIGNYGSEGFNVVPSPVAEQGVIYFENPRDELFNIRLFDLQGHILYDTEVKGDRLELPLHLLPSGLIVFSITNRRDITYRGRFLKL